MTSESVENSSRCAAGRSGGGSARAPLPFVPRVLVVDDDRANCTSLKKVFEREGFDVLTALDGKSALELARTRPVHVVLTDLMMPGMSGTDLLRAVRAVAPETEVILMTAYGTVETAVEAMKEGAYDFVTKPFKRAEIVRCVRRAIEKQALVVENRRLRAELETGREIVGSSPAMTRVMQLVRQVAPSTATVLILGESGTGKELVARAIHRLSQRAQGPFVAVNCAALPESILESELFGHERGAFTGAVARRPGRFELAHGGTLFLDEVGEMSPAVQVRLLRVLQEGAFERLGGTQTVQVDVRVVAATNKDLEREVREGRFREDLYYRLHVIRIELPPLREREGDVELLAHHFAQLYARRNGRTVRAIRREALEALQRYHWPGNVRELENAMERAVVLAQSDTIDTADLPPHVAGSAAGSREPPEIRVRIGTPLDDVEQRLIRETLRWTGGDKRLTAHLLGVATRTIYRKLDRMAGQEAEEGSPDEREAIR